MQLIINRYNYPFQVTHIYLTKFKNNHIKMVHMRRNS